MALICRTSERHCHKDDSNIIVLWFETLPQSWITKHATCASQYILILIVICDASTFQRGQPKVLSLVPRRDAPNVPQPLPSPNIAALNRDARCPKTRTDSANGEPATSAGWMGHDDVWRRLRNDSFDLGSVVRCGVWEQVALIISKPRHAVRCVYTWSSTILVLFQADRKEWTGRKGTTNISKNQALLRRWPLPRSPQTLNV